MARAFFSKNISAKASQQNANKKGTFYDFYIILKNTTTNEKTTYNLDYIFIGKDLKIKVTYTKDNGQMYFDRKILEQGEPIYFDDMQDAQKHVKNIVESMLLNNYIKVS